MKKVLAAGLIMFAASHIAYADDDRSVSTRAGKLTIVGEFNEMKLLFNGNQLQSGDGLSLSFKKKYSVGDSDIVLVMDNSGGAACPAQYFFIAVHVADGKARLSPSFGTCSDLIKLSQQGEKITVTMPNVAEKGSSKYVYENGVLTENGKVIK